MRYILTLAFVLMFFSLANAGNIGLYQQLKNIESATKVGINSNELRKMLYPVASEIDKLGITDAIVKQRQNNPRSSDWLYLAYKAYLASADLLGHGISYHDDVQKMWTTASQCLVMAKKSKK